MVNIMAKSTNTVTSYQNEIRYQTKFDSSSGVLTIHEELHWFPSVLIYREELKRTITDEKLNEICQRVIDSRIKQTSQQYDSYQSLIERGFTVSESTNPNIISLNGVTLNYGVSLSDNIINCNGVLYNATQKNTALFFRIAQLYGKLK